MCVGWPILLAAWHDHGDVDFVLRDIDYASLENAISPANQEQSSSDRGEHQCRHMHTPTPRCDFSHIPRDMLSCEQRLQFIVSRSHDDAEEEVQDLHSVIGSLFRKEGWHLAAPNITTKQADNLVAPNIATAYKKSRRRAALPPTVFLL